MSMAKYEGFKKVALDNFSKYLKIPSVHPDIDYYECVDFLKEIAKELQLESQIFEYYPNKPILVLTWKGRDPKLPSILLNSHMDVVPVYKEKWTHDPFGAEIDDEGNIYARGTQDMKSVGIQYLEAIRALKQENITLQRTIHVSFVPDEEIGAVEGMQKFIETDDFNKLNVDFALDEGCASPGKNFYCFYGERTIWQIRIRCEGQTGHGSQLFENTAGEKVRKLMDKIYDFRKNEFDKLDPHDIQSLGDVTTINVTMLEGGVQVNVIPFELILSLDCRIAVTVDLKKWEEMLEGWCRDAGSGVFIEYTKRHSHVPVTPLTDENKFWVALKKGVGLSDKKLSPGVFPGATDARYFRKKGISAIGFSPICDTPILAHDHDEYLNVEVFLNGIDCYVNILKVLGNLK